MSVNTKIIPTNLNSNSSTSNMILVTKVGADSMNGDEANFNHIIVDTVDANRINVNDLRASELNASILKSELIYSSDATLHNLNVTDVAEIEKEIVGYSEIQRLEAGSINANEINSKEAYIDEGVIKNLFSTNITTDYLKVLKSAHFFELIIDQIKAAGGSIILSPADGFELYGWSNSTSSDIRLWWIASNDNKGRYNRWEVGDQAICQNFNSVTPGYNKDVASKYCWAYVTNVHNNTSNWVVKLGSNDEVTQITDNQYNETHPSLKKSDFVEATPNKEYDENNNPTNGVWRLIGGDEIIDGDAYAALTETEQEDYYLYQYAYYTVVNNVVLYITQEQYLGSALYNNYKIKEYSKIDCQKCFSITISKDIANGKADTGSTFDFVEGDNFAMLGSQLNPSTRGAAIYLSAYNSIDPDLTAPLIAQYRGIGGIRDHEFELERYRWSYFDATKAYFKGEFYNDSGSNIESESAKLIISDTSYMYDENGYSIPRILPVWINYKGVKESIPEGFAVRYKFYNSNTTFNSTTLISEVVRTSSTEHDIHEPDIVSYPQQIPQNTKGIKIQLQLQTEGNLVDIDFKEIKLISKAETGAQGAQGANGSNGAQGANGNDGAQGAQGLVGIQGVQGTSGAQGATGRPGGGGEPGEPAIVYELIPVTEIVEVRLSSAEEYESIGYTVYVKLQYMLYRIEGDTVTPQKFAAAGFSLILESDVSGWTKSFSPDSNTVSYEINNVLTEINSGYGSDYFDYKQCFLNHSNRCPTYISATLYDGTNNILEKKTYDVSIKNGHVFVMNDKIYVVALSGESKAVQAAQGIAELNMTVDDIEADVIRVAQGVQGANATAGSALVTAQSVQTYVKDIKTGSNNLLKRTAFGYLNTDTSGSYYVPSKAFIFGTGDYADQYGSCWMNGIASGATVSYTDDVAYLSDGHGIKNDFVSYQLAISSVSSGGHLDFKQPLYNQSNGNSYNRLKPSTWYTLTFSVKATSNVTNGLRTGITETKQGSSDNTVYIDGVQGTNTDVGNWHYWDVTNNWVRHSYTFKTSSQIGRFENSTTYLPFVFFRFQKTGTFYLSQLMLEEGTAPSGWTTSTWDGDYYMSQIKQTNKSIELSVYNMNEDMKRTGIDIEDGSITLTGDNVNINGSLNLLNEESGFILYDNNLPVISILNTPVGDVTNTKQQLHIQQVIELGSQSNTATFHLKRPWMIKSGETYELDNLIAGCMVGNSGANISSINITVTLKRGDNNSTISTIVSNRTISGVSGQAYVNVGNDFTFTTNYTGYVYFDVAMTITFVQSYSSGSVLYGYINGEITQPVNKIVKLGNDGFQVVNGSNKYCTLGSSNYTLRQGDSTLTIGNDYMKRTIGSATGDIGSIVKVKICTPTSENYQYLQDDGLVIFRGSWAGDPVYYLPNSAASSSYDGRIIYFKNLTGRTLHLRTSNSDNVLINANSNTPTTEMTVGTSSCMMICGGGYWIYYFMG